jgi:hypothetical protein
MHLLALYAAGDNQAPRSAIWLFGTLYKHKKQVLDVHTFVKATHTGLQFLPFVFGPYLGASPSHVKLDRDIITKPITPL